jgi:hypothetical protein
VINDRRWWINGAMSPNAKIFIVMGKTDPGADRDPGRHRRADPRMTLCRRLCPLVRRCGQAAVRSPAGRPPVPSMGTSVPSGRILPGDLKSQHDVIAECVAHLGRVHLQQGPVGRASGCDHHMVDRRWQILEEPLQGSSVISVEGRRPLRPTSFAAWLSRTGSRPVRTTSAPSARACRAVSSPMPALPPITSPTPDSRHQLTGRAGRRSPVSAAGQACPDADGRLTA